MAPSAAYAECGVGGIFSGECVDVQWRNVPSVAFVGEIIELDLYAVSVNSFNQPVQEISAVLDWDPNKLRLVGRTDPCASSDACFDCSTLGLPEDTYNWSLSLFARDDQLDRLNADCGPNTFCNPFTGLPFNDGNAWYSATRQLLCGGQTAEPAFATPSGLWVTSLRFEVLSAGVASVTMVPRAECHDQQMICVGGDSDLRGATCVDASDCVAAGECVGGTNDGNACQTDVDCPDGGVCEYRRCLLGLRDGEPCSSNNDCPGGGCPVYCTGCSPSFCCTTDPQCNACSFKGTKVTGDASAGEVTGTIGPPAAFTVSACAPPTVAAVGPRYFDVIPPTGATSVAIYVEGAEAGNACVSGYVRADGTMGLNPVFQAPSGPSGWNKVHVRGDGLVSGKPYRVRADCNSESPGTGLSDGVEVTLWKWGDTDNSGVVDILDATRILDGFRGLFHTLPCTSNADCSQFAPHRTCDLSVDRCLWVTIENVDLMPDGASCTPDRIVSIFDAVMALDAFRGIPAPCPVSCP